MKNGDKVKVRWASEELDGVIVRIEENTCHVRDNNGKLHCINLNCSFLIELVKV